MEPKFWHQRWQSNRIGFHESETNPLLVRHLEKLQLQQNDRLFLPLCGKTLDIAWLLSKGYRVAGAELSEMAVEQLFEELGVKPDITRIGKLLHFKHDNIDIFAGDIFELSGETLGPVDAIYDRAALVALPQEMRYRYTEHLTNITNKAPQLLICFEYDQSEMDGPPFSINAIEVKLQYIHLYDITLLEQIDAADTLPKAVPATESAWLLRESGA